MFAKLFYSILSVILLSTILDHFYQKYFAQKHFLRIELDYIVDRNWVIDLNEYIIEYLPDWGNESFTKDVGRCNSKCYEGNTVDSIYYDHQCQTHPILFNDGQVTEEKLSRMTYAEATVPCFLELALSKIPGANRGIFTKVRIPKGSLFGPYEGVIRSAYGDEGDEARGGGYAWRVNRVNEFGEDDDFYIDGVEETNSNWLRYVNTARYEEEQNQYVLIFNETVYYIAYKDIEPGAELLVWYGKAYAAYLNIDVVEGADHDWTTDFAPKLDIVVCDSCPRTQAMIDALNAKNDTDNTNASNNNDQSIVGDVGSISNEFGQVDNAKLESSHENDVNQASESDTMISV